jgi:regulatory protein
LKRPEPSLRERALRLLARREYSRDELQRRLAPHVEEAEALETLLDDLKRRGWLSEQRVVEQVVHARQAKFGGRRIAHELREKGVAEELIAGALGEFDELATARSVWAKKFGALPADANERGKQMRFLMSRGFGGETIRKVLQGSGED